VGQTREITIGARRVHDNEIVRPFDGANDATSSGIHS
jgi:hypothetical protein